jgi:hypothetical protein
MKSHRRDQTTFRIALLALALSLCGCGASHYTPLPKVRADDPTRQLNPDRWHATVNDLMTPPDAEVAANHG